jgi:TRAP-type C4-dicarboxylate transport system substrate-binding protein
MVHMKKYLGFVLVVVLASALALGGCAAQPTPPAQKPTAPSTTPAPAKVIELKLGHHNPPTGRTTVKYIDAWAKKVEAATNGQVKITSYPAEALFKSKDAFDATIGGVTDIAWSQLGNYPGVFWPSTVLEQPFLSLTSGKIDGKERSGGAVNSRIIQELYDTLPEMQAEWKNVKLLFIHCSDPFVLFTSKKQVKNINDLKGLKLRELAGSKTEMWKLLGAVPSNVAMPETYEAVDKGVLDGASLPWAAMATYKLYEVTRYWGVGTSSGEYFMMMNNEKWNSLPPDIQKAIMSVSGVAGAEFAGDAGWGNDVREELLAAAEKAGKPMQKVDLDAGEYDKWKEIAGKPLWDKWVSDLKAKNIDGQKILSAAQDLLKKYGP